MEMDMIIEYIPIEQLKLSPYNPRKDLKPGDAEYEKLKRSLVEFGYVDPIIWNKQTGNIVGGHQRFKIMRDMGLTKIKCVVLDIEPTKEKALNIALNKISGDWNMPALEDLLKDLESQGYDLSITGFDAEEIREITGDPIVDEDDFDLEEALEEIEEPETKPGDVWILGRHRLICGDSTMPEPYTKLMAGGEADLILTDPPYNVNVQGGTKDKLTIKNDNMDASSFLWFLTESFSRMCENTKKGGAIYVFHADSAGNEFRQAFSHSGYDLHQCLIWVKSSMVLGRQDYQWIHEPILYGWKPGAGHYYINERCNTTVIDDKLDLSGLKKDELLALCKEMYNEKFKGTTIIKEDKPFRNSEHPTMKPVKLCGRLIMNSTREDEVVLDPFGGSGSTLIACEQAKRSCRTIELDPVYCDVIVKRWEELTGEIARKEVDENGKENAKAV